MEKKYLPIGTVCTLKGKTKKVMITGFYSVEFNGNIRINDYVGCTYPEGMMLPNQVCTFNHTDIETINFIGYVGEEQLAFSNLLDKLTGNEPEEEKAKKFHEDNEMFLTSNSTYSKLLFDENGVVMIADLVEKPKEKAAESSFKNIKFDENGTVISIDNSNVENPFYKEYDFVEEANPQENNIFKKIEFNEDGTVISAETMEEKKKSMLNNIEFDENGVVIGVGREKLQPKSEYEFDSEGNVISAPAFTQTTNEQKNMSSFENIDFDENGVVVAVGQEKLQPQSKYEFDSEGNVISAPAFTQTTNEQKNISSFQNIDFDENGTVIAA